MRIDPGDGLPTGGRSIESGHVLTHRRCEHMIESPPRERRSAGLTIGSPGGSCMPDDFPHARVLAALERAARFRRSLAAGPSSTSTATAGPRLGASRMASSAAAPSPPGGIPPPTGCASNARQRPGHHQHGAPSIPAAPGWAGPTARHHRPSSPCRATSSPTRGSTTRGRKRSACPPPRGRSRGGPGAARMRRRFPEVASSPRAPYRAGRDLRCSLTRRGPGARAQ